MKMGSPKSEDLSSSTAKSAPSFVVGEHHVSLLDAHLLATILEDVLKELSILGECNNAMRNYKMQLDLEKMRETKFGMTPCVLSDELFGVDPKNLECDTYKLQKHAADRNMCFAVLSNTYIGLVLARSYEALIQNRDTVEGRLDYFLCLIDEQAKNKIETNRQSVALFSPLREWFRRDVWRIPSPPINADLHPHPYSRSSCRELRRKLRQQRNRIKSSVYETNLVVDELVSKYEDASKHYNCRGRYIDEWKKSRSEQHNLNIRKEETKCSSVIMYYRIKADEEERVHTELVDLINTRVSDTLKEIENCMNKYENDMDAMDVNITVVRINYETQLESRLEIEQKLADHSAVIQKWVQYKAERENLRAYQDKMVSAAIIVQAWWRGLLVRLELGPFKPTLPKKRKTKKRK